VVLERELPFRLLIIPLVSSFSSLSSVELVVVNVDVDAGNVVELQKIADSLFFVYIAKD
jgi:hypothetical protein